MPHTAAWCTLAGYGITRTRHPIYDLQTCVHDIVIFVGSNHELVKTRAASEHGALVVSSFFGLVQRRSTGSTVPRRIVEGVIHLDGATSSAACACQQDWSAAGDSAVLRRQHHHQTFKHSDIHARAWRHK